MILDAIVENKRHEVEETKKLVSMDSLQREITDIQPARDFRQALREPGISLIAEIKKASPSKGAILLDADVAELGMFYQKNGARAISILTDKKFFKGSIVDLKTVRSNVKIPCLRKEFIIDPYQIYEARAAGADAILLIMRILNDQQVIEFLNIAYDLKMGVLVETHTETEVKRALDCGAHIIGINNRNLDTLEISLETTERLKKHVPGGHVLVSESGIYSREQVEYLENGGIDAILVGESILTNCNVSAKIRELLGTNAD